MFFLSGFCFEIKIENLEYSLFVYIFPSKSEILVLFGTDILIAKVMEFGNYIITSYNGFV